MINLKNKENGFTLLEMLITICIFTVLLGVVLYFGFDITGINFFLSENLISQNELQLTLNSFVTEIRSMGPSNVGSYPIESATASSFVFYSDSDQDGLFERIRYYMAGNTLMRGIIKPTGSPLTYNSANEKTTESIHFVTSNPSTIFSYYARGQISSSTPMVFPVNPNLIRSIKAQLTTDRDTTQLPEAVTYRVFATIRNFRLLQ
jgi:prepilin-type N-terminal cleavage/methylation domain-containing protein